MSLGPRRGSGGRGAWQRRCSSWGACLATSASSSGLTAGDLPRTRLHLATMVWERPAFEKHLGVAAAIPSICMGDGFIGCGSAGGKTGAGVVVCGTVRQQLLPGCNDV